MIVGSGLHLTYCSNIHPGESWTAISAALRAALPRIRTLLEFNGPLAIGLRLSADAALQLEQPETLAGFVRFLREGNYYVPTINGFPYGAFHGTHVKERVYLPDWREAARLDYSNRLASILSTLLAERPDIEGSVSTVPGAFRRDVAGDADVRQMAANILRHAAYLVSLRMTTGAAITLAIEPEPACFMETVDDAVGFFTSYLFDDESIAKASTETGIPLSPADVRRHIGICLDVCHMAVEFEDPAQAVERLRIADIRILKIQVSSALRLEGHDPAALQHLLAPFAEDTYLHQVVERSPAGLRRYCDLPEALSAVAAEHTAVAEREWRVHFHVPIFLPEMRGFATTQQYLASVLALVRRHPPCHCLEVETYTWDVLPPEYRTTDMATAIARELAWARDQLQA